MTEDHPIGFYLKTISQIMDRHFNRQLKEFDLTKTQYDVLRFLWQRRDQDIIQRDIEVFFRISNPTVTGILNRLEDKDFITRQKSARDKRVHTIQLTPKGLDQLNHMCEGRMGLESVIQSSMNPEELEQLAAFLKLIMERLIKEEERFNA